MSAKAQILKEYAEYHYNSLEEQLKGLEMDEANYQMTEESNSIEWIVNHLCRISNTALPRIIKGDPNYKPLTGPTTTRSSTTASTSTGRTSPRGRR